MAEPIRLTSYYPSEFPFEDFGVLRLRIARLDVDQAGALRDSYERLQARDSERQISVRLPGEEQEKRQSARPRTTREQALIDAYQALTPAAADAAGQYVDLVLAVERWAEETPTVPTFVVSDEEIRVRRLAEMSNEALAAWQALVRREEAEERAFIVQTITDYVTVEPGQLVLAEAAGDRPLTAGADLVRYFGGRVLELRGLTHLVMVENQLSAARKKAWRSLWSSNGSSEASAKAHLGTEPVATAAAAETKGSAGPAAAMESPRT